MTKKARKIIVTIVVLLVLLLIHDSVDAQSNFCVNVPVLMYHHIKPAAEARKAGQGSLNVTPEFFESQLQYLVNKGYTTIKAEDLVNALLNGQGLGKAIVITMDDGYDDIYTYAYPLAKKYGVVLNLMIPTGLMDNQGFLTWSQLKEMIDSGVVKAYNHTWSHTSLRRVDNEKAMSEVSIARTQLNDHLGGVNTIIAYPYGSVSGPQMQMLAQNGFRGGFSTISGKSQCQSFIMALHRTRVGNARLSTYGI